ncbi:MAG: hypothetical protein MUE85_14535 [Microscillaceae bacterium]|jgi:hypothetical protein|nr:hypothetical protein [Microscillaceae bacterium]
MKFGFLLNINTLRVCCFAPLRELMSLKAIKTSTRLQKNTGITFFSNRQVNLIGS